MILQTEHGDESFDGEIILASYQAREGQHVVSDHGIVVSLDLILTEELKAEGLRWHSLYFHQLIKISRLSISRDIFASQSFVPCLITSHPP